MGRRWNVEVRKGVFEDVGAEDAEIVMSGALVFSTDGDLVVAYAPGQWITLTPEEDGKDG